jgi:hypothetical protein
MGLQQRETNIESLINMFHQKGIQKYERYQVLDNFREEYADDLFRAAKVLHELVDVQKRKVFVND